MAKGMFSRISGASALFVLAVFGFTCFGASPVLASNPNPDTLHLYLTADREVYFHWNARFDELDVVSSDAKALRKTLSPLFQQSPQAAAVLHASLTADPGLVHQVSETARISGAGVLTVVALEKAEKNMIESRLPGYALQKQNAPAIDGYTLTILVYQTPHFIYYLNESYPDIQVAPFDSSRVKEVLRPFADAKIAVKIHDKASAALVKQLFSVFNELEIVDFGFFIWTPDEEAVARQRTQTNPSPQIKK